MHAPRIAIVGGGAAGYFAAANCAEALPYARLVLFEGTQRPLAKVRISGGGRCNVTHHCFDPSELVTAYPRGQRELRSAFSRFQPKDTVAWFAKRGVELKVEADGRMFPVSNNSATIVDCLLKATKDAGVETRLGSLVKVIRCGADKTFHVTIRAADEAFFDAVIMATGSSPTGHDLIKMLGHKIVSPVPSLFTFNVDDERLKDLAGITFDKVELHLNANGDSYKQSGPLLITHWGLSGPAVLKLSAWAARSLFDCQYKANLQINFLPDTKAAAKLAAFTQFKAQHPKHRIASDCPLAIPKRFWQRLVVLSGLNDSASWANLPSSSLHAFATGINAGSYEISGKGVFKEEFVTCGGVALNEVDFRTMQSRVCPSLYFAGEVLYIDGITGGFNFQNAWTSGFIAASALAQVFRHTA